MLASEIFNQNITEGSKYYEPTPSKAERQKQGRVPLRTLPELSQELGVDPMSVIRIANRVDDFPKPVPGISGRKKYYVPQQFLRWAKKHNIGKFGVTESKICPVCGCTPCNCTHIVKEGMGQQYLWHGSRQKISVLEPRQSVDTGGAAGSNQNAIYATADPKVAIAMGLTTPGSDTGMFPNDPQMVLFSGKIRKGENVYLHKLPMNGADGQPQFVQGGNSREFHSVPGVKGIKPIEIKAVPVDKYLNLIRQATPQDLELRKKYMKQGVAENSDPCWSGYKQIGMKKKAGKTVPNCVPEGTEVVPAANPEDTVSLDIPLLIRLLEYSREDAKTDMDLHNVAERLITLSAGGRTLSMTDYDTIIPGSSD